jgi:hypothetical protein
MCVLASSINYFADFNKMLYKNYAITGHLNVVLYNIPG